MQRLSKPQTGSSHPILWLIALPIFLMLLIGTPFSAPTHAAPPDKCHFDGGLTGSAGSGSGVCDGSTGPQLKIPVGGALAEQADDGYTYWWEPECTATVQVDQNCANVATRSCVAEPDGQFLRPVRAPRNNLAQREQVGIARCVYPGQSPGVVLAPLEPEVSLAEFQKLPIVAAEVTIQPSPHTLIGAETNAFAEASEQILPLVVLSKSVRVKATPTDYIWDYGDGVTLGPTPSAGSGLPISQWGQKTRTSHIYTQTRDFQIVLTTRFTGQYSVEGGPW